MLRHMGGGIHLAFQDAPVLAAIPAEYCAKSFNAGAIIAHEFDDFDEMAMAAPNWNQEYFKLGRERAGGSVEVSQTARMQLGRIWYRTGLLAQGLIPPDSIAFLAHTGESPLIHRGHKLAADEIAVLRSGVEFEFFARGPLSILGLCLNEHYLLDRSHVLANSDTFAALFPNLRFRLSGVTDKALLETIPRLIDLTLWQPHLLTNLIAARRMEDEIASLIVSGTNTLPERSAPLVRHRAARRGVDYIRANAEEPFTIYDLCKAIGASQRTLEIGFQELFGLSPKAYINRLRLRRARRDLLAADPSLTSVTDVAAHWGFYHFGRFAKVYSLQYDELPSATIKRQLALDRGCVAQRRPAQIAPPQRLLASASG